MCVSPCMCAPWMLENSGGLSTPGHQDKDKVSGPTLYIYITSLENPTFHFKFASTVHLNPVKTQHDVIYFGPRFPRDAHLDKPYTFDQN